MLQRNAQVFIDIN